MRISIDTFPLNELSFLPTLQITPGRTLSVNFTKMQCQAHSNPGTTYQYSQSRLKILIDSHSPRWILSKHKPKSTRASDGQVKRVELEKVGWQWMSKAALSFPFGAKAECGRSDTKERSTSDEGIRFNSRIVQRQNRGVFWWIFHVDDEYEKECGIELGEDSLPSAEMSVLPCANTLDEPLNALTVEITSFWSLLRKEDGGWLSYPPGDSLPPGFSNLCHVACFDLPSHDGNCVADLHVGPPGKPTEQVLVMHAQSNIVPRSTVLMQGGKDAHEEGTRLINVGSQLL
jgi:hypothetical protein